jgi:hypothetical protein
MIKIENGKRRYFDRNGREITEDCMVKILHGDICLERIERVYLTTDGQLGTDATNKNWIARGWATECEYGIYPFTNEELEQIEVIDD